METNKGDGENKNGSTSRKSTRNETGWKHYNNKFIKNKYINKNDISNVKIKKYA